MHDLFKLRYYGYVEINDDIWFANQFFNALIKLNKLTGKIQIVDKFPDYEIGCIGLYSTVLRVDENLIFVPNKSEKIVAFNIKTKKFSIAPLDLDKVGKKEFYFLNAYVYKQYVYMFPVEADCLIRYNVVENTIKYIFFPNAISVLKLKIYFIKQYEVIDKKIYIPFAELNAIAIFNPQNEDLRIVYLNIEGGCSSINYLEGYFYLAASKTAKIYQWDEDTGEIKIYDDFPGRFEADGYIFLDTCVIEGGIFFFPFFSNMIISFDISSKIIYEQKQIYNVKDECKVYFAKKIRDVYYVLSADMDDLCILKYRDQKIELKPIYMQDNTYNRKEIGEFLLTNKYYDSFVESENTLEQYIDLLVSTNKSSFSAENNHYGSSLWKTILP